MGTLVYYNSLFIYQYASPSGPTCGASSRFTEPVPSVEAVNTSLEEKMPCIKVMHIYMEDHHHFFDFFKAEDDALFFDVLPHPVSTSWDIFAAFDICLPEVDINCEVHTYKYFTLDMSTKFPAPLSSAYHAVFMGLMYLMYTYTYSSFPIIFDTGASLIISFNNNHFVGPICSLYDHKLCGLANGLDIRGIDTVKWKFRTKGYVLILASFCYYVPNARGQLISPHHLFNKEKGITG